MLRLSDPEWMAIKECLYDYQPRNKREWCQAVAVGLSLGQGIERQIRANEALMEAGIICKRCGAVLPCPECGSRRNADV